MLKISSRMLDDHVTLVLEGSLSGPWVAEVESVWRRTSIGGTALRVTIDLSGVTFVSDEGRQLLENICASGAEVVSSDLLTKTMADDLSHKR